MLLPVVGCPNVFTNDDDDDDDDEASFLPSSSSFGFFLVEGASSGWSENIGRLFCDDDDDESDDSIGVVIVVDASSSTYEFTGTIGKKEDAPPPSPPPLRVVALIVLSWAFWVKSLVKKRVKSEGEFVPSFSPHILCAHFLHARAFLRRAKPPRRDVAKDTETTEKAARNIPRREKPRFRWCEAEETDSKSFEE